MTEAAHKKPRVVSGLSPTSPGQGHAADHAPLPVLQLDPRTYSRALDCVHCGLCLPACPTYTQNGLEADSPRGRIALMKGLADGEVQATDSVIKHLDLCLDCRACETACPSGVVYHELIEETRAKLADKRKRTIVDRVIETMFFQVMTYPFRLKVALLPVRIMQKVGLWRLLTSSSLERMLPAQLRKMQQMLPPTGPLWESKLAKFHPARHPSGVKKATVGFMPGCVGSVLFQTVNRQTIELLQLAGCDVVVPGDQECCGAIHHHGGKVAKAESFARQNIDVFMPTGPGERQVDFVVNNIAGCGAMLKDYGHLLRDDPTYCERAESFELKLRDISELLVELGLPDGPRQLDRTITYHHACHLAHAQKVTEPPLTLLKAIPGLNIVPLVEADMCCGAAGTYNLSQPQMATELAERKIKHIQKTGARLVVTGNVGCAMQIQSEAAHMGVDLHVAHPVSLLHEAYCQKTSK